MESFAHRALPECSVTEPVDTKECGVWEVQKSPLGRALFFLLLAPPLIMSICAASEATCFAIGVD